MHARLRPPGSRKIAPIGDEDVSYVARDGIRQHFNARPHRPRSPASSPSETVSAYSPLVRGRAQLPGAVPIAGPYRGLSLHSI